MIVSLLGQGGMGAVYEAEDSLLGRRVALKLITTGSDSEMRERMRREARTAAALEHPNVVMVYDVGEVEDGPDAGETFLAMELVRGRSLRSLVRDRDIPLGRKLRWLIDVAHALDAAHAAQLIHRDIKPDNLMVRDDGAVKVLDFGIAKKTSTVDPSAPTGISPDPLTLTKAGSIVGTPRYASPEQLRGDALDGGADQYSWGVTAYELLSGRTPFETDDPVALLSRVLSVDPPKLREKDATIPEAVEAVIHRAMSKQRTDRFDRLADAALLLEPFADAPFASGERRSMVSVHPSRTPPAQSVPPAPRARRPAFARIAATFGVLAIAAIAVLSATGKLRGASPEQAGPSAGAKSNTPLKCSDARVSGPGASPDLAHMFGIGACARLGVATGVPWTHDKAVDQGVGAERQPLDVVVTLADRTRVTLGLGKAQGTGESSSPIEAMQAAVADLASRTGVAPLPATERAEWGATTDDGARRIERVWRRLLMDDLKDAEAEAKALVKAEPDSPWSYAILGLVTLRGSKTSDDAFHTMEAKLDRVSGARQRGLRALAKLFDKSNSEEAMREFRKAYSDAPDDADIAGLYAAVATSLVSSDEGFAVIDRLAEQFPTRALLPLQNAITAPSRRDVDRNGRYLARFLEVFPEARCRSLRFSHLKATDKLAEARASAKGECATFYGTASGDYGLDLNLAAIELSAGEFDAAHAIAAKRMGDPRASTRTEAAEIVIDAYLASGRIADGEETLKGELARQRDQESWFVAMQHAVQILKIHRRLGTKPPAETVAWLAKALDRATSLSDVQKLAFEVQLALAEGDARKADDLLARIEKTGDAPLDVVALPLVRARKGNKAAVELLQRRRRAHEGPWYGSAVDAALALEATHASGDEIRDVLRILTRPNAMGFETACAEAILRRVAEAEGKPDEAAKYAKALEKRFAKADRGIPELVAKIK